MQCSNGSVDRAEKRTGHATLLCGKPEAQRHDFWCPTYDFAYFGAVNNYRLRCMVNHGDFNYFFVVYQKERTNLETEGCLK